ncbi:branched-chain amino acid ABC transporter permease [Chloroflexota bacterium]
MEFETVSRVLVLGFTIGCTYALMALGLNLLWGTMRMLNVAHGSLIMLGAYAAYWLFVLYGVSPLLSGGVAVLGGAALGLILYRLLFRAKLKTTKSLEKLEVYSYLIFFGSLIIIDNVASLLWTSRIRGYTYLTQTVPVLGTPVPLNRLFASVIAIAVAFGFYFFLRRTMFGKAIRAVIQDNIAAQLMGINVNRVFAFCFAAAFATAGLSGTLLSMFYPIQPFMGLPYTMTAFVVVILGGLGNILGSLIGGIMLGIVVTAGVSATTPGFGFLIMYIIFILVILVAPSGILGRRIR